MPSKPPQIVIVAQSRDDAEIIAGYLRLISNGDVLFVGADHGDDGLWRCRSYELPLITEMGELIGGVTWFIKSDRG